MNEINIMVSQKQKQALEKISGKPWNSWCPEAIVAYFAYIDKGQRLSISNEARADFEELVKHHWAHCVIVEMWKEDFLSQGEFTPLLYLWDFEDCLDAYARHAFETYRKVRGYIPIDEFSGIWERAKKLGVSNYESNN